MILYIILLCRPTVGQLQDKTSILSSTPLVQRKCLFPESHNNTDLSSTMHQSTVNETVRSEWLIYIFKI